MAGEAVQETDTVIIGNGPSSLILSYILHGHIPCYVGKHKDAIIDQKLSGSSSLLHLPGNAYSHLRDSLKYSSQALQVNTLLDALLRPNGDLTTLDESCVEWRYQPEKAVPHIVLGAGPKAGGQWAENPVEASWSIGSLSYAEQLSLPGYTFADHWQQLKKDPLPDLIRPSRQEVADYYATYPSAVGIEDAIRNSAEVRGVSRTERGTFSIPSHGIECRHLVLASGIYAINIPPPPLLSALTTLTSHKDPLLVIGSGFTAADLIISTPPDRKIIHIYNWDPENHPSPLSACHPKAYPEYAAIYQQMKLAAFKFQFPLLANNPLVEAEMLKAKGHSSKNHGNSRPTCSRTMSFFLSQRDWEATYEGLPNCRIMSVKTDRKKGFRLRARSTSPRRYFGIRLPSSSSRQDGTARRRSEAPTPLPEPQYATVEIGRSAIGLFLTRKVSELRYATGRRGTLNYLGPTLMQEVLRDTDGPEQRMSNTSIEHTANGLDAAGTLKVAAAPGRSPKCYDWASDSPFITAHTFRNKVERYLDDPAFFDGEQVPLGSAQSARMEVAPGVFIIGSLTGDSLVRFAYGGCVLVAGSIIDAHTASR